MTQKIVTEILCSLGIEQSKVHQGAHLKRDLELDSTDTVQVAIDLKKMFGVEIKFESKEDMTVGQLCTLLERRATERQSNPTGDAP